MIFPMNIYILFAFPRIGGGDPGLEPDFVHAVNFSPHRRG